MLNVIRLIHLNWLAKLNSCGQGPLVVNIIFRYCCTRVLRVLLVRQDARRN